MSHLTQALQYSESLRTEAKDKFGRFIRIYNPVFFRWMDESLVQGFADILSATYLVFKQTENIEQIENKKIFGKVCKELGVKQLLNGKWITCDPSLSNSQSLTSLEEQGFDVVDEREEHAEQEQIELPAGVIVSTREFSAKLHITMRRAQQIFAAQVADLRSGQDLFGMGV